MKVEFNNREPIYLQIIEMIKLSIVTKELSGGDKLPSVREMADRIKVNPNTIQRVYQELERENITFTQRGMGTFITDDKEKRLSMKKDMAQTLIKSFIEGMKKLDFNDEEILSIIKDHIKDCGGK